YNQSEVKHYLHDIQKSYLKSIWISCK
ncbi:MAG: hypothetical protein MIJ75_11785, partial [Staphylococcus aureus]|nr:hypothetical protein [Staphylococcus aureus]